MSSGGAIVVGSEGQDGILMRELLSSQGIWCEGIHRGNCDIRDFNQILRIISRCKPRYLFYFAAHHTSAAEENNEAQNQAYFDVNTIGALNCLDAIKQASQDTHFFYASSSLIFTPKSGVLLNEQSELSLSDLYSISKHASMKLCDFYREKYGIKTTVGIMFNHESRYRKSKFVSKKIVEFAAGLSQKPNGKLVLGDLDAVVDWGAAEDYVKAAFKLLKNGRSGDYVISSGEGRTVRNFCEIAFSYIGVNYNDYVVSQAEITKRNNHSRIGNNEKLRLAINWKPNITFEKMIHNMLDAEMEVSR
jgi:GDPmannose 4,6-dehydratase